MHAEVVPSPTEGIRTDLLEHDHMVCTLCTTDPDGSLYSDGFSPYESVRKLTSFPTKVWAKQNHIGFRHPRARLAPDTCTDWLVAVQWCRDPSDDPASIRGNKVITKRASSRRYVFLL